ncbi:restriction endonuclease subunit S [Aeromonas dhakensis]|uniref:restriction endonuclease subunit S n=1 Tax=Aeromonas dhakensis TaxID=196024 RepID=UPI00191D7CCD|nr:restriction endonuclease subunit S [Aeromonas dhakensis]MBL0618257.1 restriction endonuclease subunit S [Aeromonas dhakensis]
MDALIDYRGKTPVKTDSGVPLVTAKVIKGGRIETPTEFIAPEDYDSWMRRGIPLAGDVVMTTEAPLGEVAQLGAEQVALAQRVITLRGKTGFLDNAYLLYLLQTEEMQDQLKSRATGTTVLGIKQSELRKVRVKVPPFDLQQSVAGALKTLDDRIALLRETNATLESIAQTLFKSWFVDFDPVHARARGEQPAGLAPEVAALFPDCFEESALGKIPKGWDVGVLGDVAETSRKQIKPEQLSAETLYVGLEHIPRKQLGLDSWGTAGELASAKSAFERNDILFGKLRPYFHKVVIAPFEGVCSTDILVCKAKQTAYHHYVAMHLFSDELIAYADRLSNGAKMPRINWKDLAAYEVTIPPSEVAEQFYILIEPMIARMLANVEQAQTLANLRDTLLPRLISGQLRLSDAEQQLKDLAV